MQSLKWKDWFKAGVPRATTLEMIINAVFAFGFSDQQRLLNDWHIKHQIDCHVFEALVNVSFSRKTLRTLTCFLQDALLCPDSDLRECTEAPQIVVDALHKHCDSISLQNKDTMHLFEYVLQFGGYQMMIESAKPEITASGLSLRFMTDSVPFDELCSALRNSSSLRGFVMGPLLDNFIPYFQRVCQQSQSSCGLLVEQSSSSESAGSSWFDDICTDFEPEPEPEPDTEPQCAMTTHQDQIGASILGLFTLLL